MNTPSSTVEPATAANFQKKDRLDYFYHRRFKHYRMETVMAHVFDAIQAPERNTIIQLIGPARAGKTTLLEFIVISILNAALAQMEHDRELIPVALLEATAPDVARNFDFSEFYRRILILLDEVGVMHKRATLAIDQNPATRYRQRRFEDTFNGRREALENVLKKRRLETLLIDEGHSLTLTSAKMLDATMAQLKSLANVARVPIVLCGTYHLTELSKYDAQLIGRTVRLHFSRYHSANDQDIADFRDIVQTLIAAMPMHEPMGKIPSLEFFMDNSLGLVGALKQWMLRALLHAINDGSTCMKCKHFEDTLLRRDDLRQMREECLDGEEIMEDAKDDRNSHETLGTRANRFSIKDRNIACGNIVKQTVKRRPGQRKPTRDPVNVV